jgi:hypothetical protein
MQTSTSLAQCREAFLNRGKSLINRCCLLREMHSHIVHCETIAIDRALQGPSRSFDLREQRTCFNRLLVQRAQTLDKINSSSIMTQPGDEW